MIQLYKFNNNNFKDNGDIVLQPTSCMLTMELHTAVNEIELHHPYDREGRWKLIEEDAVISIPTPYLKIPEQLYRIYYRDKTNNNELVIKARHIFYDLIDTIIKDFNNKDNIFDVRCVNCNGQQALDKIFRNTRFIGHSDILDTSTAYYYCKNVIEAIANGDNSFFNRWGGELFLNNFDVYINYKVGMDNGVRITYGKNLSGLEEELNWDNVVTRIIPVGYDGIMLNGDKPWVDSPLLNKYSHVYEKVIKYEDVKLKGTQNNTGDDQEGFDTIEEAREELINRAKKDFEKNIDKPLVNYKVDFIDLSKVDEYKNYKILEQLLLGDTVKIEHEKLNININARLIKFEYNVLTGKMETLELGNYLTSLAEEEANNNISLENINSSFDDEGNLKGSYIKGFIDATKAPILAQKSLAKKLDSIAWKMEILDPNDPNFGCILGGTKGILISDRRTPDGRDWDFTTAVTAKGIVANTIVSGTLSTILIQNADGSFQIDLSGFGGAKYFTESQLAMAMQNNSLLFYNWAKQGDYIGELGSYCRVDNKYPTGNPNMPLISLVNDTDSAIMLGYKKKAGEADTSSYIDFDKYDVLSNNVPIYVRENMGLGNNSILFGEDQSCELYCSEGKDLVANCKHGFGIRDKDSQRFVAYLGSDHAAFGKWNSNEFYAYFQPDSFTLPNLFKNKGDSTIVAEKFHSNGDITCSGKKNRVVETEHYGKILQNAVESAECWFMDDKVESSTDESGECTIYFDPKFLETVNTKRPYIIYPVPLGWKCSSGEITKVRVVEKSEKYFKVKGTPNTKFDWSIKAKQKDYENDRLEGFKEPSFIMPKKEG